MGILQPKEVLVVAGAGNEGHLGNSAVKTAISAGPGAALGLAGVAIGNIICGALFHWLLIQ